jgi:Flp pilus assembly protein TadG
MRATTHFQTASRPARRRRRGNAVVELALTLGILLNLAFGIVEFGYYFFVKNTLEGAAREGARAAVVPGAIQQNVTDAVTTAMSAAGLGSSGYSTTTTPSDVSAATSGQAVTVNVTCTWGTVGAGFRPLKLIGTSKSVLGVAVMRKEG